MESAQTSAMHIYILRRFKSRVMPYICVCKRRQVVVPFHPHSREAHTLSFSAPLPSRSIPQEAVQQSLGDPHPTPEQPCYPEDTHIDHTYKTILVRLMMMERHDRRDRERDIGRERRATCVPDTAYRYEVLNRWNARVCLLDAQLCRTWSIWAPRTRALHRRPMEEKQCCRAVHFSLHGRRLRTWTRRLDGCHAARI